MINWEDYRDGSGNIQLRSVFLEISALGRQGAIDRANAYLRNVESLSPVRSRQVAALAIAHAQLILLDHQHDEVIANAKAQACIKSLEGAFPK